MGARLIPWVSLTRARSSALEFRRHQQSASACSAFGAPPFAWSRPTRSARAPPEPRLDRRRRCASPSGWRHRAVASPSSQVLIVRKAVMPAAAARLAQQVLHLHDRPTSVTPRPLRAATPRSIRSPAQLCCAALGFGRGDERPGDFPRSPRLSWNRLASRSTSARAGSSATKCGRA